MPGLVVGPRPRQAGSGHSVGKTRILPGPSRVFRRSLTWPESLPAWDQYFFERRVLVAGKNTVKKPKKSVCKATYCRTLIDQHNELWAQVCPAIGHHPCTIALDAYRFFRVFGIRGRFVWAVGCPTKLAILCEQMPVAPTSSIWMIVIPFVRRNVR